MGWKVTLLVRHCCLYGEIMDFRLTPKLTNLLFRIVLAGTSLDGGQGVVHTMTDLTDVVPMIENLPPLVDLALDAITGNIYLTSVG